MTKFFEKFKSSAFGPFWVQIFLENSALSNTISYGFLVPCQNLEKFNDTIQRKRLDRRKGRRIEERIERQ